jgi:acetyltransferase-like isoleucine patch superfamily enzyme
VQIGAAAHIGAGAVIRQGIRVGTRSVVGAGAVVVRDVPDDAVVAGVPAKPLN